MLNNLTAGSSFTTTYVYNVLGMLDVPWTTIGAWESLRDWEERMHGQNRRSFRIVSRSITAGITNAKSFEILRFLHTFEYLPDGIFRGGDPEHSGPDNSITTREIHPPAS